MLRSCTRIRHASINRQARPAHPGICVHAFEKHVLFSGIGIGAENVITGRERYRE
jgi:hypothetical protein